MFPLTPWVKRLLVANIAMFLAQSVLDPAVVDQLVFYPLRQYVNTGTGEIISRPDLIYKPWTVVTYMFLHGGINHLFMNMLALYFFGPRLEERLGGADFLKLYFLAGVGGALFSFAFARESAIIGASGGVFGVTLGFALYWPYATILLFFVLPMPAWLLAVFMVAGSLWAGISGAAGGIAHFAHLGGAALAFAYLKFREWRKGSARREFRRKLDSVPGAGKGSTDRGALKRWETIRIEGLHELNREEVVTLLEKARGEGVKSLSESERRFLDRMVAASDR